MCICLSLSLSVVLVFSVQYFRPCLYGENLSLVEGSLAYTLATQLGEPTFPTFPYKTWQTVYYMRNQQLAQLHLYTVLIPAGRLTDSPSRITLFR